MEKRCKAVVRPPVVQSTGPDHCADRERSTYSFTWPSLVRGQSLNGRRDPMDQDFVRIVDARSWVGSAGCRAHGEPRVAVHRRRAAGPRGQGTVRG